jgi:hypothetical protein
MSYLHRLHGQGTFQNLNFESATLSSVPPGEGGGDVSISAALPGWTGYLGGVQTARVFQNEVSLGASSIDILGPQWNKAPGIIDGNYSVYLQPGDNGTTTSIAQSGTIPSGTQTLIFDAWQPPLATPFSVSFSGDTLSPLVLFSGQSPSGQAYDVYGANVASFAGQTGQLEFTVFPNNYNSLLLDDISFSSQAIPEPNPIVLTGIGGLIFAWYRLRLRCR